jgi:hypothetical protein
MTTLTRPRPHALATTHTISESEARAALARVSAQINQLAAAWRAQIAARVLGIGRDRSWSAEWAAIEAQMDSLFNQKRHLLMQVPHRVC